MFHQLLMFFLFMESATMFVLPIRSGKAGTEYPVHSIPAYSSEGKQNVPIYAFRYAPREDDPFFPVSDSFTGT